MTSTYFDKFEEILKFIENKPQSTLNDISENFSISPTYLQKVFKQFIGISPKEYSTMFKFNNFRKMLEDNNNITDCVYGSTFEYSSCLYEKTYNFLGMKPLEYQQKKFDDIIMLAIGECSLGSFLIAQTKKGICNVSLSDSPEELIENIQKQFPKAFFITSDNIFEENIKKIISIIENPKQQIILNLPLDMQGTIFQKKVWNILKNIPIGKTVSYMDIAQMMGLPKSARAVAKACASNNIAILIPCHRVIRKDGEISGYRWGIERKKEILKRENKI